MRGGRGELTVRGRSLLGGALAVLGCGVALDELDLVRLGALVAVLPPLALLLAARSARAAQLTRHPDTDRLVAGSSTEVVLRVSGPALLGSLRVTDTVPDAAGPDPAAPPRFSVRRAGAGTTLSLRYPLHPPRRGVHRLGPASVRITDPLGLAGAGREIPGTVTLTVLPRVEPLHDVPAGLGSGEGPRGAGGARAGQGVRDLLVRPWRDGDELRRVHWRSTARHDELMVRTEERPRHGGATVLLDRRDRAHRGRGAGSSLEFAVATVASVCAHLHARGEVVSVVTDDGAELAARPAGPGPAALDPVLDALAALRPSASTGLAGLPVDSDGLLAVLGAVTPEQLSPLLAQPGAGHAAILLDVATWDPAERTVATPGTDAAATVLRNAGWTVARAGAGDTPATVWARLRAGGHTPVKARPEAT